MPYDFIDSLLLNCLLFGYQFRKNMLVFLCKGDLLVFIKKDGFSQGTYDDFKTFITTKTNLSF